MMNYDDDDDWTDCAADVVRHGVWRRMFRDCVTFQPDYLQATDVGDWEYLVEKYPFVPGFHVVSVDDDGEQTYILSTHKTLAEAMGVCKILLANGGVRYV